MAVAAISASQARTAVFPPDRRSEAATWPKGLT